MEKVLLATFVMSLTIEVGQVILDLLIDANRVFELDDLWTNTLGGLLALAAYRLLVKLIQTHFKKSKKTWELTRLRFHLFSIIQIQHIQKREK